VSDIGFEIDARLKKLVDEMKKRGLRVTIQRLAIASTVFEKIKSHPSFMDVLEEVRKRTPGVSTSTVYNTLQLMEKLGFITSFSYRGETHYDQPHPHVNVVCMDTGKIVDLPEDSDVLKLLEKKGVKVKTVVVYGYCGASGPG